MLRKRLKKDGSPQRMQFYYLNIVEYAKLFSSLKNYYMICDPAEKMAQLVRLLAYESSESGSARFIVYFATCACVDYFYRVSSLPHN